jgi:hypothetical protein
MKVLLIGCVGEKRPDPAPARDLYASTLFRLRRAYAEGVNLPWYILSAKHRLIDPDEIIAPYDTRLSDLSKVEQRAWGAKVFAQLEARLGGVEGRTFEFHAGKSYVNAVKPGLEAGSATVLWPLKGLRIGEQLHWYKERLARQESGP